MTLSTRTLFALLLATSASAQSGGFTPGQILLYSPDLVSQPGQQNGGLIRIDPSTGQCTVLANLPGATSSGYGSMTYDAYRDRVLYMASDRLTTVDAAGNMTDLGFPGIFMDMLTPASGGRIYCSAATGGGPLHYLDANNVLQNLLDVGGTQVFAPAYNVNGRMLYDAGTNALFIAMSDLGGWSCGGATPNATIHRLPLTADGSALAGPVACAQIPMDPGGDNAPVGLTRGPDGKLMVTIDNNSSGLFPRVLLIDPVTLAVSSFASPASAALRAGTWSSQLGKAVVLDTGANVLRIYGSGQSGDGSVIPTTILVSSTAGSGEWATLVEVPVATCESLVGIYCTPKTSSSGCVPALSTSGCPSAAAASGFVLQATQVEAQKLGLLLYGKSGPAALPFQGGLLCVQGPILRCPPSSSGAAAACSGVLAIDFNAFAALGTDPALVAGSVVHAQFWFRDPNHPIGGIGLSGGVTFTLAP